MAILNTGMAGAPLIEILHKLGNKSYAYIEVRCKFVDGNQKMDELIGSCTYDAASGVLSPLDQNNYSLNDRYIEWEPFENEKHENCLIVWRWGVKGKGI